MSCLVNESCTMSNRHSVLPKRNNLLSIVNYWFWLHGPMMSSCNDEQLQGTAGPLAQSTSRTKDCSGLLGPLAESRLGLSWFSITAELPWTIASPTPPTVASLTVIPPIVVSRLSRQNFSVESQTVLVFYNCWSPWTIASFQIVAFPNCHITNCIVFS
jgi:hypothetical protein